MEIPNATKRYTARFTTDLRSSPGADAIPAAALPYKIPPKKPKISPVYPPAQRITVSLVIADIPPIIEMKNPARSPSVVHSISETARKAAEACDFFT